MRDLQAQGVGFQEAVALNAIPERLDAVPSRDVVGARPKGLARPSRAPDRGHIGGPRRAPSRGRPSRAAAAAGPAAPPPRGRSGSAARARRRSRSRSLRSPPIPPRPRVPFSPPRRVRAGFGEWLDAGEGTFARAYVLPRR